METKDMKLTIGHLYPDLLNLYGDRGNIACLMKRCIKHDNIRCIRHCINTSFDSYYISRVMKRCQIITFFNLLNNFIRDNS